MIYNDLRLSAEKCRSQTPISDPMKFHLTSMKIKTSIYHFPVIGHEYD